METGINSRILLVKLRGNWRDRERSDQLDVWKDAAISAASSERGRAHANESRYAIDAATACALTDL
ncbi:hypothetical protein [Rhodopseudomonas palustris]|uniref:hypothetical protein n=1 Tax=Rhodopseudomonas palustris TaxID=1076 RepID=UPI0011C47B51|nr:hypothetical protein [Rhodopseudomonas palustris]